MKGFSDLKNTFPHTNTSLNFIISKDAAIKKAARLRAAFKKYHRLF